MRKIITLALALASLTATAAVPTEGKVYRIVNADSPTKAIGSNGDQQSVSPHAVAEVYSQYWLTQPSATAGAVLMYNLNDGTYLHSPCAPTANWTSQTTVDAKTPVVFTANGSHYTLRAASDATSFGYAYLYGSDIFCLNGTDPAAQWDLVEIPLTQAQIDAALQAIGSMGDVTGQEATLQGHLDAIFTDKACTTLAAAYISMTDAQLRADSHFAALPAALQQAVRKVRSGDWSETGWDSEHAKKFRVQSYEPYSRGSEADAAGLVKVQAHTNMNNPTGVVANAQSVLYVMVQGDIKEGATLYFGSLNGTGMLTDWNSGVELHTGLNVVPVWADNAAQYVFYTVATTSNKARARKLSAYTPLTIHIEGGELNGFFNSVGDALYTPDTQQDWLYYRTRAKAEMFDLVGQYVILHFHLDALKSQLTESGKYDLPTCMKAWDDMCFAERLTMGLQPDSDIRSDRAKGLYEPLTGDDVAPSDLWEYFNNRMLGITIPGLGGMNATSWRTAYNPNDISSIIVKIPTEWGALWGPAHEYGHINQQPMLVAGTTEISNNVFSNIAVYYQGGATSRAALPEAQRSVFNRGLTFLEHSTWGATRMYWQLWCYYHATGHNRRFYPRLYELLRRDPLTKSGYELNSRYDLLHFAKKCCEAAGEDLTEFFTAWGFFVPQTNYKIDDYSVWNSNLSQADIDAVKAEIAAMHLPVNHAILYIDDRVGSTRSSYGSEFAKEKCGSMGGFADYTTPSVPDGKWRYSVSGSTLNLTGGTGGVGFAVYDDAGALIGFGNDTSFDLSPAAAALLASGHGTVMAVGGDNSLTSVTDALNDATPEELRALLADLLKEAKQMLDLSMEGDARVGYYRYEALADLRAAHATAQEVYTAEREADYATVYSALSTAYHSTVNATDVKVGILADRPYIITNSRYGYALTTNGSVLTSATKVNAQDDAQRWLFTKYTEQPGRYYVSNVGKGVYMSTHDQFYTSVPVKDLPSVYDLTELTTGVYAIQWLGKDNRSLHIDAQKAVVYWYSSEQPSQWIITLADVDTGIDEIEAEANATEGVYDMLGRKLTSPTPGLNIINGRKIIVK